MPRPNKKSDLPVGAGIPFDLSEAAELLDRNLTLGQAGMFRPIPTGLTGIDSALGGGLHAGGAARRIPPAREAPPPQRGQARRAFPLRPPQRSRHRLEQLRRIFK